MKKELLKKARIKYPKGTVYKNIITGKLITSSGQFEYDDEHGSTDHIFDIINRDIVWDAKDYIWAKLA